MTKEKDFQRQPSQMKFPHVRMPHSSSQSEVNRYSIKFVFLGTGVNSVCLPYIRAQSDGVMSTIRTKARLGNYDFYNTFVNILEDNISTNYIYQFRYKLNFGKFKPFRKR